MTGPAGAGPRAAAGDAQTRLHPARLLIVFAVMLGAVILVAAIVVSLTASPEPPPNCQPGVECGGPPPGGDAASAAPSLAAILPPTSAPTVPPGTIGIRAGTPYSNTALGFQFEYSDWWAIDTSNTDPREVDLVYQGTSGDGLLIMAGAPTAEASPTAFADKWFATLQNWAPDLAVDDSPKNVILGPEIGFVDGIGRVYAGTRSSAQSATTPIGVSMIVASDGTRTAAAILIVWNPDKSVGTKWLQYNIRSRAEIALKTFRWGAAQ
ncbi:MAG: hypothetical protein QOI37_1019 [Chloroflexota bacterium]|nr:hypothetical protein [Chloroflexota bacterium]MEA2653792.1 hypothetical protein [Chloroflexota bacterium]